MTGKVTVIAYTGPSPARSRHLASAHIDAFRAVAPDLLAEPPNITLRTEVKN